MDKKHLLVLNDLRVNARERLRILSEKNNIPLSTVFVIIQNNMPRYIKRYVSILDFETAGFHGISHIVIKAGNGHYRMLKEFLKGQPFLNSIQEINNGYHFFIETIFPKQKDIQNFIESIEKRFRAKTIVFPLLDDLKREGFEM